MRTGAFFILDCLGFKGVWERAKPMDVLDMLAAIERSKESIISATLPKQEEATKFDVSLSFLSDTIVGGVSYLSNPSIRIDPKVDNPQAVRDQAAGGLLFAACVLADSIFHSFLESSVPLSMRGCISYGEFLMSGNFILGPAVDEAAELSEIAEGAFIWLTPAADRIARPFLKSLEDRIVENLTTKTWDSPNFPRNS